MAPAAGSGRPASRGPRDPFGPGGHQRFGVAPLFQVHVREGRRVTARAQRLEARRGGGALLVVPAARERDPEVVHRGGIERLALDGRAEEIGGLVVPPLLEVELPEVHARAEVGRIDREHAAERRLAVGGPVLAAGDEAEHVVRLWCVGPAPGREGRLLACLGRVGHVEQRDGQVDAGEAVAGIDRQGPPEGSDGRLVIVLLEVRDTEVVLAVRSIAIRGATRGLACLRGGVTHEHGDDPDHRGARETEGQSDIEFHRLRWSAIRGAGSRDRPRGDGPDRLALHQERVAHVNPWISGQVRGGCTTGYRAVVLTVRGPEGRGRSPPRRRPPRPPGSGEVSPERFARRRTPPGCGRPISACAPRPDELGAHARRAPPRGHARPDA